METSPNLIRLKAVVQRVIEQNTENNERPLKPTSIEIPNISKAPRKLSTLQFLPGQKIPTKPSLQRQKTLAQFFTNLIGNKETVSETNISRPKLTRLQGLVNVFIKATKKVTPSLAKTLSPEEVRRKFIRAFHILRVLHRLNRISEDIQLYGTSSNLFDLTTRDRTRVKRILYPSVLNETEDQLNEEKNMKWYIVHPKSRVRLIWSLIVIFLLIYTATVMPYRLTFDDSVSSSRETLDNIVDCLFFIDLIFNFFSAYYDEEGKFIKDPKVLAKSYLKSWFLVDLLAIFPFDLVQTIFIDDNLISPTQANFNTFIRLFRLPRLYKLIRILRINNIFKFLRGTRFIEWIELHSAFIKLFSFLLIVVTFMHIMACIWYLMAKLDSENPETWIVRKNLVQTSDASIYITSLYYIFSTLATVGYGDITSETIPEKVFSIILMILGVAFYSFTIGLTASALSSRENRESSLKRKISIANEFSDEINAPRSLKSKITKILEYNSFRNCFSWANKREIFSEIPISLRYEIVMTMHNSILNSIPFFREHSDKYFVVTIAEVLKPLRIKSRDYLWKEGDSAESMYFLITGKVSLISSEYLTPEDRVNNVKTAIIFKRFMAGSYFGEIEIISKTKRNYSLQANAECELFYLTKHDYFNVLVTEFPHIHEEFKEIALERDKRNAESLIEIRNFLHAHIPEDKKGSKGRISRSNSKIQPTEDTKPTPKPKQMLKHMTSIEAQLLSANLVPSEKTSGVLQEEDKNKTSYVPEIKLPNLAANSGTLGNIQGSPTNKNKTATPQCSDKSIPSKEKASEKTLENSNSSESYTKSLSKIFYTSSSHTSGSEDNDNSASKSQSRSASQSLSPDLPGLSKTNTLRVNTPQTSTPYLRTDSYGATGQRYQRSKSSLIAPIIDEKKTRRNSIRISTTLKFGAVISSEDLDDDNNMKKKKNRRRSREKSFLKLIVGTDSEEGSSESESIDEKNRRRSRQSSSYRKDIKDKKEAQKLQILEKIQKNRRRDKRKATILKKNLQTNSNRMNNLEEKLGLLVQDMEGLLEDE